MATVTQNNRSEVLGPVSKSTLAEQVVAILKRFILVEDLKEGDRLPSERKLVATLGVSQRVVREALGILTGEGIVNKRHGLGAFVQSFDRQRVLSELAMAPTRFPDATDLHEARCAIEYGIACIAAEKATDKDLATLQECIAAMQQSADQGESPVAADLSFHQALLRATHNETLQSLGYLIAESIRLHDIWKNPAGLHRKIQDVEHIVQAHQAIVDALRQQDAVKASQAVYSHLMWRIKATEPLS